METNTNKTNINKNDKSVTFSRNFKDPQKNKIANSEQGLVNWEQSKQDILNNGEHIRSISSLQRTGIYGCWDPDSD